MDIEDKLSTYRARKRKQEYIDTAKTTVKSFFSFRTKKPLTTRMPDVVINEVEESYEDEPLISTSREEIDVCSDTTSNADDNEGVFTVSRVQIITFILYFILWVTLYVIFLKLGFALPFLGVSALIFICFNTRTGPKPVNEVSAYSVFNKNCESIDGTLKAEQFEREIRFGPGSVR